MLITGAGGTFTAGNDIHDFVAAPPLSEESPVLQFLSALVRFDKPLIAAVNGSAIGVGTTMLLHCDLVLASEGARFALPFASLGLCPEGGSSLLLPELLGFARASELLIWGEPFDAHAALRFGIINEVVAEGELVERTSARLARLIDLPPGAVSATKRLLREPLQKRLEAAMASEAGLFRERLASAEATEAFTAFLEKRKPRF